MFNDIMVQAHEDDIDNNAEGNEELCESIKDQHGQDLCDLEPDVGAVPDAEDVDNILQVLQGNHLAVWTLVFIVVIFVEVGLEGVLLKTL